MTETEVDHANGKETISIPYQLDQLLNSSDTHSEYENFQGFDSFLRVN